MATVVNAEGEQILQQAVDSGSFKDREEALAAALQLLGQQHAEINGGQLVGETWRNRFHLHLTNTPPTAAASVDDSRAGIYEGRGE